MGDFNEIRNNNEKKGGPHRSERSFDDFRRMIATCDLHYLKSIGNRFSWTGKRYDHDIQCCLDRTMANSEWLAQFPSAQTEFLPFEGSDHRPLVTNISSEIESRRGQFCYDKRLYQHESFRVTVIDSWKQSADNNLVLLAELRLC